MASLVSCQCHGLSTLIERLVTSLQRVVNDLHRKYPLYLQIVLFYVEQHQEALFVGIHIYWSRNVHAKWDVNINVDISSFFSIAWHPPQLARNIHTGRWMVITVPVII